MCEEIARFILGDTLMSRSIKGLRHSAESLTGMIADVDTRIGGRDSAGDAGRRVNTSSEFKRAGVKDIFCANIGRAKESVRVLEEFSKLYDEKCAAGFKDLRYRIYEIEKKVVKKLGLTKVTRQTGT